MRMGEQEGVGRRDRVESTARSGRQSNGKRDIRDCSSSWAGIHARARGKHLYASEECSNKGGNHALGYTGHVNQRRCGGT